MRRTGAIKAFTVVGALSLAMSGCGDAAGSATANGSDPLKIGVVIPQSGTFAPAGQEVKRGYELAIEKAGSKAGGRPVELVFGDAGTPEDALAEAERLGTREKAEMIVGSYSTPISSGASDAAARLKLTFVETQAVTDSLTERGLTNYFRVGPRAVDFAKASASFVVSDLSAKLGKKVFVEHEDGPYGTSVAGTQVKALKDGGLDVEQGTHKASATDVTDSVLAAKRAQPDVWLITGYDVDLTLLLRTAAAQNFRPKATVLVGAGDTQGVYRAVGAKALTDTFVVTHTSPKVNADYAPGNAEFFSTYKAKYNTAPLGTNASTAFSGMSAVLKMLDATKGDATVAAMSKAAGSLDIAVGQQANGWGVKFDENRQNQLIRLLAVQWRADGTVPAVWPAEAAVDGEQMKLAAV